MGERRLGIILQALPLDQSQALQVAEVLSRAATGLALEGISCGVNFNTFEVITEEEEV